MDPTNIFDLPNTSLLFWEIVTLLILTVLLYLFVYRSIRDRIRRDEIRQHRQSVEPTSTRPTTDDRIERLRRALMWRRREPSRYELWVFVVL